MKFQHRERKNIRLSGYDYSSDGYYFVTICTKDRQDFFGEIRNGIMGLNEIGLIACKEWIETERIRDNVLMDEWVVMPNHVHGIVVIDNGFGTHSVGTHCTVGTHCNASLRNDKPTYNQFGPQCNNLASIIRGFKSSVKRICNKNNLNYFEWQSRFYDHIIRNEKSLNNIREYIQNNPWKWQLDVENQRNKFSEDRIKQHYNDLFIK